MYLFITEDGSIYKGDYITEDETNAADSGILDIINTSGPQPTQYINGSWYGIDNWGTIKEKES